MIITNKEAIVILSKPFTMKNVPPDIIAAHQMAVNNLSNDWTPMNEESPKKYDTYLVAWRVKGIKCPYPHFYELLTWDDELNDWEDISKLPCDEKEVEILAWRLLPDFFKEE